MSEEVKKPEEPKLPKPPADVAMMHRFARFSQLWGELNALANVAKEDIEEYQKAYNEKVLPYSNPKPQ